MSAPILPLHDLAARLDRTPERRVGLVLANGIFDLLHVGHVRYLTAARAEGRSLLVAVNADESVRRLKGPGRPLVPLEERMEIVAAIQGVDWVTWFEGDRVDEILRRIRPSVHAKGTDYTVDRVPERALAASLGIRTVIVGDAKRHASSDLVEKVKEDPRGDEPTRG